MGEKPLEGKAAIVTGSARNIGRATALRLAASGAAVLVNAVADEEAAQAVAAEIEAAGGRAAVHMADVADRAAVEAMAAACADAFGGIDILVLNASQRGQVPFLEMTHEEFRRVVDISLDGAFFAAQACLPHMIEAGGGRIVAIGGISWHIGTPNRVHNLVAKSGLTGFARGLAVEMAEHGVTVNSVSPGFIDTVRPGSAGVRPPLKIEPPVNRFGDVEEIASMVHYLCLPEAAYITGQTLHVNGGVFLGGG